MRRIPLFRQRSSSSVGAAAFLVAAAVAVVAVAVLTSLFSTPASAAASSPSAQLLNPPHSVNGTHTVKGELNAFLNTVLSQPPSYLPATRISSPSSSSATFAASINATSSLECFKRCAVSISFKNVSLACYGATFTPATRLCTLLAKKPSTSSSSAACPSLILAADPTATSALFPSRYSSVSESCITSGPRFKDGPPFEVPTAQDGIDAAVGIALEGAAAAVVQGATIRKSSASSPSATTLTYLGSVAQKVSPAVCSGICARYKTGANWTDEPTDFAGAPWAVAAGFSGIPRGVVISECVASSHYSTAAAYQQADDRFEYVCDLWGFPRQNSGLLPSFELRPQEPGGRNSASILLTSRWKRLPRS